MTDSKKQYVTAVGFVQFDPNEREVNGKTVTDIVLKLPGGEQTQVRVTIWPEIQLPAPIVRGDFVAVDGQFSSNTYQGQDGSNKTSLQISAYNVAVLGTSATRADREIVSSGVAGAPAASTNVPF